MWRGAPPVLAACLALCAGRSAPAAGEPAAATTPPSRPRIALVLAGGGAKGGAHVGVLKVLEELHVPVDCVVGTSMGSLVGGGYAAGMSAAEIETFLNGINWRVVIGGVGDRRLEPAEQKRAAGASTLKFELAVKDGRIITPGGLISSSSIESVLRAYVARARTVEDFDRLPIPYRAVATDMLSGTMVVIDHGDIAHAMRASMAIPGVFTPVQTDKYVLSDGMVVRNLPVDVGRQLCGDIVIAVNIVKPDVTRDQVGGALKLVARSMDVMIEANEQVQLAALTPKDVRIDVDPGDIGAGDFERTSQMIPIGERAARAMSARLAALALPAPEYAAWREHVTMRQGISATVADVQFAGLTRVNPEYLRSLTRIRPGMQVTGDMISEDARRMAVLDDITAVDYDLVGDPQRPVLVWRPQEDPYGPNFLRANLGLYMGGGGDTDFVLGLRHVRYWLNPYGGQWRNAVQVGTYALLDTNLYQPLNVRQSVFVLPELALSRSVEDVFNNEQRVARYIFVDRVARLDGGFNFSLNAQLRFGYWIDKRDTEVDTGPSIFPTVSATDAGPTAFFSYDSRSTSAFSTDGMVAGASFMGSDGSLGGTRDWEKVEAAVRKPILVRDLRIWITAAGGTEIGNDLPADRAFALGGPQSFPGYSEGQLRARKYWVTSSTFLYPVVRLSSLQELNLYGGLSLEAGDVYDRVDPVPDGRVYSIAAFFGGRSPLGNIGFGVGRAGGTTHSWGIWLKLGQGSGRGSILNDELFR